MTTQPFKINFYLLSLLATLFLVCSCKKTVNTEPPPPTNPLFELAPNAILIEGPTSQVIQSVDSSKIVFNGNTTILQNLAAGDIIVSGIAPNAPFGFLRKITNVQSNGTVYTFTTTDVPLTEAFKELHINYSKSYTKIDTLQERTSGTSFNVEMPGIILYDLDGNNATTYDQLKVDGNFNLAPVMTFIIDISYFHLDYAKIECGFETVLEESVTAGGSVGNFSKKIDIFSKPLALFTIPGTPFVVVPNLRVSLGAEASIHAVVSATETNSYNVNAYLEYEGGAWNKGYDHSLQSQFNFSGLNGNASATVYVEPAIDFKLWNSDWAKGSITSRGYLEATGQLIPTQTCELKAGVSAGAEANLSFFGWNFAAASYPDIFNYSTSLYTCAPVNALITISNPSVYPAFMTPAGTICAAWETCNFTCSENNWDATTNSLKFVDANGVTRRVNGVLVENVVSTWWLSGNFISSGNPGGGVVTFTNVSISNGIVSGTIKIGLGDGGYCAGPHTDLLSAFDFRLIYSSLGNTTFNTNLSGTYEIGSNSLHAQQ